MKSKFLAAGLIGFMALGGTIAAGPGPNGNNDGGLCTAYFNGQKNGHDNENAGGNGNGNGRQPGEQPGPFQGLEEASRAYAENDGRDNDGDGEVDEAGESEEMSAAEAIFNYCDDNAWIGGNPEHGRFDCERAEDDPSTEEDESDQVECEDNPAPGNSGGGGLAI